MKGTAKQVKWAEDIIRDSRATIALNIKRSAENGFDNDVKVWEKVSEQYEATIAQIDDAAVVIDRRELLNSSRVIWCFNRLNMMVHNGAIQL